MSETATQEKTTRRVLPPGQRSTRGTRPGKRGRPEWEPARQTFTRNGVTGLETLEAAWDRVRNAVRMFAVTGTEHEVICQLISPPCSKDTLYKYFRTELDHGKEQVKHAIASRLVRDALNGDTGNQRFYLATQAGWKKEDNLTLAGAIRFMPIEGDEDE
jgi:hypothetical protein